MTLMLALVLAAAPSRTFRIEQTIDVPAQSGPVSLWVPVPHDDKWQTISAVQIDGAPLVKDDLGKQAARYEVPAAGAQLKVSYTVERREREGDLGAKTVAAPEKRWLKDDKLVQVDDK